MIRRTHNRSVGRPLPAGRTASCPPRPESSNRESNAARWIPACAGMTRRAGVTRLAGMTRRGGFTLVEMLVSVALVLLIMTLFAQAFGIAAGSIKKQRGLAENDQRARSMVTILLGDLKKRTFRQRRDAITQPVDLPVRCLDLPLD